MLTAEEARTIQEDTVSSQKDAAVPILEDIDAKIRERASNANNTLTYDTTGISKAMTVYLESTLENYGYSITTTVFPFCMHIQWGKGVDIF